MSKKVIALKREKGFTMIEVMFSISFLAIALLAVAGAPSSFATLRRVTHETQIAVIGARQQLEIVRGTNFDQIENFNDLNFQIDLDGDGIQDLNLQENDADQNVGNIQVTRVGPAGLLLVQVTISWRGVTGDRNYQLEAMISDR